MAHKYNAHAIYYNIEHDLTLEPSIGKGLKGFERFDSKWELLIYKKLREYTPFVSRFSTFQLDKCTIRPDFVMRVENQLLIVEAKGFFTKDWKLKWKQFTHKYSFEFFVISKPVELAFFENNVLKTNVFLDPVSFNLLNDV